MQLPVRRLRFAPRPWCVTGALAMAGVLSLLSADVLLASNDAQTEDEKEKRASLSLKASPSIAFAPARVVVTAELRGGSDESSELYCPSLEWEWGDGTISEANVDCEPFEAGKTEIRRRWTTSHAYETGGNFRVRLRLKRGDKTLVSGSTNLQIRGGLRNPGFPN